MRLDRIILGPTVGDDIVISGESREKVKEQPEVEPWRAVKERMRGTRGTVKVPLV